MTAFRKIKMRPQVTLVDGNGIAHPRRMGLASFIGVLLDMCTIGCAKSPFFHASSPGPKRGEFTNILNDKREKVGVCLRTREGVKPVYVSPGNHIDFPMAMNIVLECSRFRIPEPLRRAHFSAKLVLKR